MMPVIIYTEALYSTLFRFALVLQDVIKFLLNIAIGSEVDINATPISACLADSIHKLTWYH